ncbi:uncharacterized protein LOC129592011 [Paramacrobiotus metropolitanus]|uniref:uncharacterized protein LOC129592011 n=1 Tax=Paramacrobiotus metropolitanus TaxID=2943436 RepID=UPI002446599D|nr:uncharacterized protein LOC129592011 [Paramacrobiotus metropolitanus]
MNSYFFSRAISLYTIALVIWNFSLLLPVHGKGKLYRQNNLAHKIVNEACNDVGEVESKDPCRPMCACIDGRLICAEILCSKKVPDSCAKVTPVTRCCPSYVCYDDEGSSFMRYPLPRVVVPTELQIFQAKQHDKKSDKSEKLL